MFENMTQERIMADMIEAAQQEVSVIEGSLLYNAISLAAVAIEDAYDDLEAAIQNAFADTCDREHLIRFAQNKNLAPYPAAAAEYAAAAVPALDAGIRLTDGTHNYIVTTPGDTPVVTAEEAGEAGNGLAAGDTLEPLDYIEGFVSCTITGTVRTGTPPEDTEAFRARYMDALQARAEYGNAQTYEALLREAGATGHFYVFENGNDVNITWVLEDGTSPTQAQKSSMISYLAANGPIGANVAWFETTTRTLTLSKAWIPFTPADGYTEEEVKALALQAARDYVKQFSMEKLGKAATLYSNSLNAVVGEKVGKYGFLGWNPITFIYNGSSMANYSKGADEILVLNAS